MTHEIPKENQESSRAYRATAPKQLGTLHERMQYTMRLSRDVELEKTHHELWHAICDLELETRFHVPADPPFGKKTQMAVGPRVGI